MSAIVEDHLIKTHAVKNSPYVKPFVGKECSLNTHELFEEILRHDRGGEIEGKLYFASLDLGEFNILVVNV